MRKPTKMVDGDERCENHEEMMYFISFNYKKSTKMASEERVAKITGKYRIEIEKKLPKYQMR